MSVLLLLVGFAALTVGGDLLVRGAAALARRIGVSPLVIGLTVVAFGTSAPELAATVASSLQGAPDVGVGNVLGSNVANVGLILGATALLAPLAGNAAFTRRDLPLGVGAMLLLVPLAWDGRLGRLDGALLLVALAVYLTLLVRHDRDALAEEAGPDGPGGPLWRSLGAVLLGLGVLVLGADLVVRGAVDLAAALGVPERVVGLTMVAFGTSLPELASAVAAAARRQGDMILGNIAGSNLFNVLAVLGIAALATGLPVALPEVGGDLAVAVGFSLATILAFLAVGRLGRVAGAGLLAAYLTYVAALFL